MTEGDPSTDQPDQPKYPHSWVGAATVALDDKTAKHADLRGSYRTKVGERIDVLDVYCLTGDMRYLTPQGPQDFKSTVGTKQMVLTQHFGEHGRTRSRTDGRWVEADIESFGEQPVRTITLSRNSITKEVRATGNHRWFASRSDSGQATPREMTTDDLRPGMVLASLTTRLNVRQSFPSTFGIAHGVVFGDGSRRNQRGATAGTGCSVDLWGEKDEQLLPYFNGAPTSPMKTAGGVEGLRVRDLPGYFKDQPSLDESPSYLYGWLAGYFAADGCVAKDGLVRLDSAKRNNLELVERVCLRLGIVTLGVRSHMRKGYGDEKTPLYSLSFSKATLRAEFFLVAEHRQRFLGNPVKVERLRWKVVSVEDRGEVEEVFCAVVPDTHSFALEDYIWTHNCGGKNGCRRHYEDVTGQPCQGKIDKEHLIGGTPGERKKRKPPENVAAPFPAARGLS